jgi:hypothetical protein
MSENSTKARKLPEINYLREIVNYNKYTGRLIWKNRPQSHFDTTRGMDVFNKRFGNKEVAVNLNSNYANIRIDGVTYVAHRIIWKVYYGEDPKYDIDHINGNRHDNRICNLRDIPQSLNKKNFNILQVDNTTGYRGVYLCKATNNYFSKIRHLGDNLYLGEYRTKEEAALVRELKRIELHGEEFYFQNDNNRILLEDLKAKVEEIKKNFENKTKNVSGKRRKPNTLNSSNTTGYLGVSPIKRNGRYLSAIRKDGKKMHIGIYDTPEEAALARELKCLELFGEEFYNENGRYSLLEDLKEKVRLLELNKLE